MNVQMYCSLLTKALISFCALDENPGHTHSGAAALVWGLVFIERGESWVASLPLDRFLVGVKFLNRNRLWIMLQFSTLVGYRMGSTRRKWKVSKKLLEGRELEFYRWEGDMPRLMSDIREKLDMLGEHWSRDEKYKCLKEATKLFCFLGRIFRLSSYEVILKSTDFSNCHFPFYIPSLQPEVACHGNR